MKYESFKFSNFLWVLLRMFSFSQTLLLESFQLWLVRPRKFNVRSNKNKADFFKTSCTFTAGMFPWCYCEYYMSLPSKRSFSLKISSVISLNSNFKFLMYWRNGQWKTSSSVLCVYHAFLTIDDKILLLLLYLSIWFYLLVNLNDH